LILKEAVHLRKTVWDPGFIWKKTPPPPKKQKTVGVLTERHDDDLRAYSTLLHSESQQLTNAQSYSKMRYTFMPAIPDQRTDESSDMSGSEGLSGMEELEEDSRQL
jgi:hypothetical protein